MPTTITRIVYIDSKKENGSIFINPSHLKIRQNSISKDKLDSRCCIKCKKIESNNKLLLCYSCKYNLTHIECAKLEESEINNFVCSNYKN